MISAYIKPNAVDLHDELAKDWDLKYSKPRFQRRSEHFMRLVKDLPISGQAWLDGGCGTGFLTRRLQERGCRVIGVDASQDMLEIAQNLTPAGSRAGLYCQIETIESLPMPDNVFDGVVCSSVIEYLDKPEACMAELNRVLKPGGILLVSVPNRLSLLRRLLKLAYSLSCLVLGKAWPRYLRYSVNEYDPAGLRDILRKFGFEIKQLDYYSPVELSPIPAFVTGSLLVCMAVKGNG